MRVFSGSGASSCCVALLHWLLEAPNASQTNYFSTGAVSAPFSDGAVRVFGGSGTIANE